MRLIDADKLAWWYKGRPIRRVIDEAPTVDAVPVVRCKDCKHYREGKLFEGVNFCFRLKGRDGKPIGYNSSDDDFCSHGERKDND